ncbi:hypothetical protein ROSI111154_17100 [Rouxiella silvae]
MAKNCATDNTKLFGRAVIIEVADGCSDTVPGEGDFMLLVAGTTKTFDFNPNTTNSSADDTKGWVENIVTSNDLTLSFEGEVHVNDKADQYGVYRFIKYYAAETTAGRQPTLWVRMFFGQLMIQAYMVITALSNDGGTDDIVTFSTEFKVADGTTVSVDDIAPAVPVTGVSVTLAAASMAVGHARQYQQPRKLLPGHHLMRLRQRSMPAALLRQSGQVRQQSRQQRLMELKRQLALSPLLQRKQTKGWQKLPLILFMEDLMTPIKEIGECLIGAGDDDYFFRPSFSHMMRIGSPQEIVQAYYDLHNNEVQSLLLDMVNATGSLPQWFIQYLNTCSAARRALMASMEIMNACCDADISVLTGYLVPSKTGKRAFVWRQGALQLSDMMLIASSLITHGIIGKAKVRQLQRNEGGSTTTEFKAIDYINSARNHFGIPRQEAENLAMTEFILMINAKYPEQKGFTREEYDSVVDNYFEMKEKRLAA